ncbi:transposase [Actinomyces ruminis]|uniref:transposase n=1 Tax=Actinomyces ruminis TaxID=1937003 RepID=UPI003B84B1A4
MPSAPRVRADHRVTTRSAHIAVGDGHGRDQARDLSIWVQAEEGASFWAHVCAELANRGLIGACLSCAATGSSACPRGDPRQAWPDTAWCRPAWVAPASAPLDAVRGLWGPQAGLLKLSSPSTPPPTTRPPRGGPGRLRRPVGQQVPPGAVATSGEGMGAEHSRSWRSRRCCAGSSLPHFVGGTPTTNSIESLNYQLRKVSKNRGQHPLR